VIYGQSSDCLVWPQGLLPSSRVPAGAGYVPGQAGYAARMLPVSPAMPVPGGGRRGGLFHDHGSFTALLAGSNP